MYVHTNRDGIKTSGWRRDDGKVIEKVETRRVDDGCCARIVGFQ